MLKIFVAIFVLTAMSPTSGRAGAQEFDGKSPHVDQPRIAIAPPIVTARRLPGDADEPPDPAEIMLQVAPRVANDASRLKWPLSFMPPDTISGVYGAVTGHELRPDEDIRFADLRKLAGAAKCRYIVVFRVKELVSREDDGVVTGRVSAGSIQVRNYLTARASIDLRIYDKDPDKYVWQMSKVCETKHRDRNSKNVSLRREQDGALNAVITQALEPFAKGERKEVAPTRVDIAVTVKKLLANGRVMIDAGRPQNVEVDMTLTHISISSNGICNDSSAPCTTQVSETTKSSVSESSNGDTAVALEQATEILGVSTREVEGVRVSTDYPGEVRWRVVLQSDVYSQETARID